jgi:TonB family protein
VPSLPLAPPPGGAEGAGGGGAGAKDGGRLRLPLGALERIAGGPAPVLATGVDEGPGTFLGTRRYRYASFFNRIQESVVAHWDPDHAYDAHDPRRSLYPYRVRVTTLWFTLDAEGRLKQLKILKRSGLDFLDEAAVRAVREASPFPNPPAALVRDGEIEFGTFSFDHGPGGVRDALTPKVPGP